MIAALVKDQVIVNCIVLGDEDDEVSTLPSLFNVDEAFLIEGMDPIPGIGWSKVTGFWEPPPAPEPAEEPAPEE